MRSFANNWTSEAAIKYTIVLCWLAALFVPSLAKPATTANAEAIANFTVVVDLITRTKHWGLGVRELKVLQLGLNQSLKAFYLCMLDLRWAIDSGPCGGTWPQKSGKDKMLNPGTDLVLAAAEQYNLGSWCGILVLCLSSNMSIMTEWQKCSSSFSTSFSSPPFGPSGTSYLGKKGKTAIN